MADEDDADDSLRWEPVGTPPAAALEHAAELLRGLCAGRGAPGVRVQPEAAWHVGAWLHQLARRLDSAKLEHPSRLLLMLSAGPLLPDEWDRLQADDLEQVAGWLLVLCDVAPDEPEKLPN